MKSQKTNNAVIDIGSNSTRMLIFRRNKEGKLFIVNKSLRYTKLAENLSKTNKLGKDAMNRTVEAVRDFVTLAKDYNVEHFYVYATSAVRDAENRAELVDEIYNKFGLKVDVISGKTEAEYGFYGVAQNFKTPVLIFDIGGGSTELICGYKEISSEASLNLGCLRSTEQFLPDQNNIDPFEAEEFYEFSTLNIEDTIYDFKLPLDYDLVGIGGTVTTLASIIKKLPIYDSAQIHKSVLNFNQVDQLVDEFVQMNLEERRKIVGLPENRADLITAGGIITLAVMKAAGKTRCIVCDYDNIEGAAYLKFMVNNPESWDQNDYNKF